MTFKAITDDIIVQEGTFGLSFIASGTVYGGQVVKMAGPMQVVYAETATDNAIGVAGDYRTKGYAVTVYGPNNIIRGHCPSAVACGADVFAGNNGCIQDDNAYGGTAPSIGVALEATASGSIRVLLK